MKKTFLFFAALFAALVSFTLTSCDGNDPEEGVITLKMRNRDNGNNSIEFNDCWVSITSSNNFSVSTNIYSRPYNPTICDAGAKKLGAVNKVPSSGWVTEISVIPGHTYILRTEKQEYNESYNIWEPIGKFYYMKIYVIDWINGASSGGIIGAEIKYCEWTPNN